LAISPCTDGVTAPYLTVLAYRAVGKMTTRRVEPGGRGDDRWERRGAFRLRARRRVRRVHGGAAYYSTQIAGSGASSTFPEAAVMCGW